MPASDLVVAAPQYVQSSLGNPEDVPPGHRFRLYLKGWNAAGLPQQPWAFARYLETNPRNGRQEEKEAKANLVSSCARLGACGERLAQAVAERQLALAQGLGDRALVIEATATSPLATGLGNEHPLENGYAFLDPYGLPYLPGSGIKGVLRRAAEELALNPPDARAGWSVARVILLFGFDHESLWSQDGGGEDGVAWRSKLKEALSDEDLGLLDPLIEGLVAKRVWKAGELARWEGDRKAFFLERLPALARDVHFKGALDCWDVVPVMPAANEPLLDADVMSPHFVDYYQKDGAPSDSGHPVPIPFLVVASQARCRFVIRLNREPVGLPGLGSSWRDLVLAAFDHAATRLGFGAKTGAGYGRMRREGHRPAGFKIEAVTACFLHGPSKDYAQWRAPSFVGLARYWFRAAVGAKVSLAALRALEGRVFGSTSSRGYGIYLDGDWQKHEDTRNLLPHHQGGRGLDSTCLPAGSQVRVRLSSPGPGREAELRAAAWSVWLACQLGGIGQRSRRGAGSLRMVERAQLPTGDLLPATRGETVQDLANFLRESLPKALEAIRSVIPANAGLAAKGLPPKNPMLIENDRARCRIVVAELGTRDEEWARAEIMRRLTGDEESARAEIMQRLRRFKAAAFGLPYLKPANGDTEQRGRHASPNWLHLHRLSGTGQQQRWAVIATKMVSDSVPRDGRDKLDAFLDSLKGQEVFPL